MKFDLPHLFRTRIVENGLELRAGMPLPVTVVYDFDRIPDELKELPNWMPFRFARCRDWAPGGCVWAKLPVNSRTGKAGSVADKSSWGTYAVALAYFESHAADENPYTVAHGIGIVMEEPYVACDLDHCIGRGVIDEFAASAIRRLDTYTEVSVSGTGLHSIITGVLDVDGLRHPEHSLEIYARRRFLVLTGVLVEGCGRIGHRQPELDRLVRTALGARIEASPERVHKSVYSHTGGVPEENSSCGSRIPRFPGKAISAALDIPVTTALTAYRGYRSETVRRQGGDSPMKDRPKDGSK